MKLLAITHPADQEIVFDSVSEAIRHGGKLLRLHTGAFSIGLPQSAFAVAVCRDELHLNITVLFERFEEHIPMQLKEVSITHGVAFLEQILTSPNVKSYVSEAVDQDKLVEILESVFSECRMDVTSSCRFYEKS